MFFTIVNQSKNGVSQTNHDSKLMRIYVAVLCFQNKTTKLLLECSIIRVSSCFVIIMGVLSVFRARKYFFPATKIHFRN